MILVAEMRKGGVFEAESKKKLTDKIIEYFAESDQEAGQIKAIYIIKKNDKTDEFCNEVVKKIQYIVDEGVSKWRKKVDEECFNQKEIRRDYLSGVL